MNKKKTKVSQLVISVVGILIGILSIILGFVEIFPDYDSISTRINGSIQFGADYYTESYAAMARAANNLATVTDRLEQIQQAVGFAFLIVGLLIVLVFTMKLIAAIKQKKYDDAKQVEILE